MRAPLVIGRGHPGLTETAFMNASSNLRGRLSLEKNGVPFLGAARVDLLEAIDREGSITQAARALGISYKTAWDAIDAMNNQADQALVVRTPGGHRGGGTCLTEYGRHVLQLVRAIEQEYQSAVAMLEQRGSAFTEYRRLLRRFTLQTSARNQWVGTVSAIQADRVRAAVHVALDEQITLVSDVSSESVRRLGIHPGLEICALVKAVSVEVGPMPEALPTGVNRFMGSVGRCYRDRTQSELMIDLPGGRSVTAVVKDGREPLQVGDAALVSFEPSAVTLVLLP